MQLFFGNDLYTGNNITVAEGSHIVEPKITSGNPGYIAGLTDVPNQGPFSVGYSPAQDINLGWNTFTDFSRQCSLSRIYLGVHTLHSTIVAEKIGIEIAEKVYKIVNNLFKNNGKCKPIGSK